MFHRQIRGLTRNLLSMNNSYSSFDTLYLVMAQGGSHKSIGGAGRGGRPPGYEFFTVPPTKIFLH